MEEEIDYAYDSRELKMLDDFSSQQTSEQTYVAETSTSESLGTSATTSTSSPTSSQTPPPMKYIARKTVVSRRSPVYHIRTRRPVAPRIERPAPRIERIQQRRREPPVIKEIRRQQQSTDLLIPRKHFQNVIREITYVNFPEMQHLPYRWKKDAITALQEAAEYFIIDFIEDAYLCTIHAKRVTLMLRDMKLIQRIRGKLGVS